jgi:hypothetical protein
VPVRVRVPTSEIEQVQPWLAEPEQLLIVMVSPLTAMVLSNLVQSVTPLRHAAGTTSVPVSSAVAVSEKVPSALKVNEPVALGVMLNVPGHMPIVMVFVPQADWKLHVPTTSPPQGVNDDMQAGAPELQLAAPRTGTRDTRRKAARRYMGTSAAAPARAEPKPRPLKRISRAAGATEGAARCVNGRLRYTDGRRLQWDTTTHRATLSFPPREAGGGGR